ncbi:MAG TPA: hypothetical protein VFK50_08885 [Sphingomicrobium sp.]|nr:hypothetical protein [Sphingomicrobium sp.]
MPQVKLKPDTLNLENRRFIQTPLRQPVFLNSVPKSGSHLLRNIVRMFVPVEQQYQEQFIQWPNMQQHLAAFDPRRNLLSWGHLWFSDASAIETAPARKILLYRDPRDWVLARARFFLSDEFRGNLEQIKEGKLSINSLLSLMIFGVHTKAPPMADIYSMNAVSWLASVDHVVRYEDLLLNLRNLDSDDANAFFTQLLAACGIDPIPADWRERVRTGSDRKQSGTARENLTGSRIDIPAELPEIHQRLIDVAAPGLRAILGYSG